MTKKTVRGHQESSDKQNSRPSMILWVTATLVFSIVFFTHYMSPVLQRSDSWWVLHTSMSIIREGNLDLDEYKATAAQTATGSSYNLDKINGSTFMRYPVGSSILAIPFVYIVDVGGGHKLSRDLNSSQGSPPSIKTAEKLSASFYVALSTVIIFLISRISLGNWYALAPSFIFAFCTAAWSTASRAMWQHGPSMLMIAAALYIILRAEEQPRLARYASLPLVAAYIIRPTNSIPIFIISAYIFISYREHFWRYLIYGTSAAAAFISLSLFAYNSFLPSYYGESIISRFSLLNRNMIIALSGNLISPSRGLLVYSPVLILAGAGICLKVRDRTISRLDHFLIVIVATHWFMISMFGHWYGGYSFGPRFFTDMIPILIVFMLPVFRRLQESSGKSRLAIAGVVVVLSAFSLFVNFMGANYEETFTWNKEPVDIDLDNTRLWDWSDPAFLRGL